MKASSAPYLTLLLIVTGLVALAATLLGAMSARAVTEVTRRIIERTDIPGSAEELRLTLVEFPPGYSTPAHRHPVPGLCYVIEGTAESQYEGEAAKVIRAGGSFQDEANATHSIFRNPSSKDTLKFVCATKIRKDQEYMVPQ